MWNIYPPKPDETAKASVICDKCNKESNALAALHPTPAEELFRKQLPSYLHRLGWTITEQHHLCPTCILRKLQ